MTRFAFLLILAVICSACPGPGPNVNPPFSEGEDLDTNFGGEWDATLAIEEPGQPPVTYAVTMLLLVDGDRLTVAGLCPGTGKVFFANSTSAIEAEWEGEVRCGVARPSCPGAELVLSTATLMLGGDTVTGDVTGRLETPCATPSPVTGTISATRSGAAP